MALSNASCVTQLTHIRGARVLVRISANVPLENGVVQNHFRIMRAIPTLKYLEHAGAKIILIGHIGRDRRETLRPVYEALKNHIAVGFVPGVVGDDVAEAVSKIEDGTCVLLENLRSHEGEVANDDEFAKTLASYADYYVNDAFSVSHREHASIVGVPQYLPSYTGLTFKEEYTQLRTAMKPKHPSLFILGGAKFATKQPLVARYVDTYDHIFIGGALANDFFKAKGYGVGTSLVSDDVTHAAALIDTKKILLPVDVTVQGPGEVRVTTPDDVQADESILDAGPLTHDLLSSHIQKAQSILWNGPLGDYEHGFDTCTKSLVARIAESTAYTIVGGGDTVAAIESLALNGKFNFLSTAGGAMLQFLERGTLPGIAAIEDTKKK